MAVTKGRNLRGSSPFQSAGDSRGSVLIITLLALCLLTVFCVQLGYGMRQKLTLLGRLERQEKLRLATEAGVKACIAAVKIAEDEESDALTGLSLAYGEGVFVLKVRGENVPAGCSYSSEFCRIDVAVSDEGSRINLNRAGKNVISSLFQNTAGLDEDQSVELACCIIDWRDADAAYQHPRYGAEDKDYRGLPRPYEAKDSEFEMLDELKLVKGMSDEIFEAAADYFTVYGPGSVNINTAPAEVLSAAGLSEELVDKIISFRLGDDSAAYTVDDNTFSGISEAVAELKSFTPVSPREEAELGNLISGGALTTDSGYYRIKGAGRSERRNSACEITSIIKNDGTIVFWREE